MHVPTGEVKQWREDPGGLRALPVPGGSCTVAAGYCPCGLAAIAAFDELRFPGDGGPADRGVSYRTCRPLTGVGLK